MTSIQLHKEQIKERNKLYVENNREKVLKKKAEYNEKNNEKENEENSYLSEEDSDLTEEYDNKSETEISKELVNNLENDLELAYVQRRSSPNLVDHPCRGAYRGSGLCGLGVKVQKAL